MKLKHLKVGDRLRIVDPGTVFNGGECVVTEGMVNCMRCKVVQRPDTEVFHRYKGVLFALGSHIFVHEGQFEIVRYASEKRHEKV